MSEIINVIMLKSSVPVRNQAHVKNWKLQINKFFYFSFGVGKVEVESFFEKKYW